MAVVPFLVFFLLGVLLAGFGSVVTTGGFTLVESLRAWGRHPKAPKAAAWCAGIVLGGTLAGLFFVWVTGSYGHSVDFEGTIGIVAGAMVPGAALLLSVPRQQTWLRGWLGLTEPPGAVAAEPATE